METTGPISPCTPPTPFRRARSRRLPSIVSGIDLTVRVGAVMIFGPRNGSCILVRQVLASVELLELQHRIAVGL